MSFASLHWAAVASKNVGQHKPIWTYMDPYGRAWARLCVFAASVARVDVCGVGRGCVWVWVFAASVAAVAVLPRSPRVRLLPRCPCVRCLPRSPRVWSSPRSPPVFCFFAPFPGPCFAFFALRLLLAPRLPSCVPGVAVFVCGCVRVCAWVCLSVRACARAASKFKVAVRTVSTGGLR